MTIEQDNAYWFIDVEWYQQNNRSLYTLAQHCLCPNCHTQLMASGAEVSMDELLSHIRDCCSKTADFITNRLPILENTFRVFLANGNQPLNLEALRKELNQRLVGDNYRTSSEVLSRLLSRDRYYGLRPVKD